jgi:hypothetical protein
MKKYDIQLNQIFHKIWKTGALLIISGFFSCSYAQTVDLGTTPKKNNQPDVHVNVNRELDNNGNVIRYDSTYSWSWSSDSGQPIPENFFNDSSKLGSLNKNMFFNDPFFNSFGADSTLNPSFNDPFFNNFENQMQEMMQRQKEMMDELLGQPPIISAPDQKNNEKLEQKAHPKKTSGNGIDI